MESPSSQDPAFVCSERPLKLRPRSVPAAGIEIGTLNVWGRLQSVAPPETKSVMRPRTSIFDLTRSLRRDEGIHGYRVKIETQRLLAHDRGDLEEEWQTPRSKMAGTARGRGL